MGGTKIIVWQLRDILKTGVFAVLGLAVIILLVYLFVPKEKGSEPGASVYTPGTYVSGMMLDDSPVNIAVTVTDEEIVSIELRNMTAEQEVFYPLVRPALQGLTQTNLDRQTADVVVDPEYSVTGDALLAAIKSALTRRAALLLIRT